MVNDCFTALQRLGGMARGREAHNEADSRRGAVPITSGLRRPTIERTGIGKLHLPGAGTLERNRPEAFE